MKYSSALAFRGLVAFASALAAMGAVSIASAQTTPPVPFTVSASGGADASTDGWTLSATGNAGSFQGNSGSNAGNAGAGAGNPAWGLYANSGGFVQATRMLGGTIAIGQTVSLNFDNGYIDSPGSVRIEFLSVADVSGNGAALTLQFQSGQSFYQVIDSAGVVDTTTGFSGDGGTATLTRTGTSTYSFSWRGYTRTGTFAGSFEGVNAIRVVNNNAGPNSDRDVYFNTLSVSCIDADGDGVCADVDCDDADPASGAPDTTYYFDNDSDGYGIAETTQVGCSAPAGYAAASGDCNDSDSTVYPGAPELCDGKDNDCDGLTDEGVGPYANSFTNGLGGVAYGPASHISQFGGDMQLIGDFSGGSGQFNGTWTTGSLSPTPQGRISAFSASFRFGFNNNANGDATADGFSFLFGNLSDGMNDSSDSGHGFQENWKGGEWGLNNFSRLNSGISVGFRAYGGSQGLTARWGRGYGGEGLFSVDSNQPGGWLNRVVYGYDNGVNGGGSAGTGSSWQAANSDSSQATAYISWAAGGDLVVSIAFPGLAPVEYLRTSAFGDVVIGENFSFGLAARIGGASWDVQIDDFDVQYSLAGFTYYADTDGDGFGDAASPLASCSASAPVGYVVNNTDCDDDNELVNALATFYVDGDGDGYGSTTEAQLCAVTAPTGYASNSTDCDDGNGSVNALATFYVDGDGDGYGAGGPVSLCAVTAPSGYSASATDCNDAIAAVNPGATEVCNGIDDNCVGGIDDGVGAIYYQDDDGDGYGNAEVSQQACSQPEGYVSNSTDCDDADEAAYPLAPELCANAGTDNDCDGDAAEIDAGASDKVLFYRDQDSDTYTLDTGANFCPGTTNAGYRATQSVTLDCDDTRALVYPGAPELCDDLDNDCDEVVDDGVTFLDYYTDS
ncbi:MAG: putative metal-binding motif-containing protein, partial [Phycisphaerales bacterium]